MNPKFLPAILAALIGLAVAGGGAHLYMDYLMDSSIMGKSVRWPTQGPKIPPAPPQGVFKWPPG